MKNKPAKSKKVDKEQDSFNEIKEVEKKPSKDFIIVGIGASAGGFEAFQTFLKNLPAKTGMTFVFVPHLDPNHESLMPELLARLTEMPVQQVKNSTEVQPNHVYIIPPNKTLTIEKGMFKLQPPTKTRGLRLPIDKFFQSLAEDQRENAVGVILSGSGSDGTIGIKAIKENGGIIFAQEIETSKYDSMPRSAIITGQVDFICPVEDIPAQLKKFLEHRQYLQTNYQTIDVKKTTENYLDEICSILRRRTGHDFANYKINTLIRRIHRRIQVVQAKSVAEYVKIMRSEPQETDSLFKDLLIGVTHFFRDHEAFEALKDQVIPKIIDNKKEDDVIRVWVPGCATGEEAYSIAILLCEEMENRDLRIPIQIFATDIDEESLDRARRAQYPSSIVEQLPEKYQQKYFTQTGTFYKVSKNLREMCLFSPHNLIRHPPFSRLDLVSCRNLLIYLDADLQRRILPIFHYALRPNGYLFLGTSESVAGYSDLFTTLDKRNRIFRAKDTILETQIDFPLIEPNKISGRRLTRIDSNQIQSREKQIGSMIESILLESYSPDCVIVNEQSEIVYFFGRTGKYLEPATGTPTNNVLDMARKGLRLDLRTLLHKVISSGKPGVRDNITFETNEGLVQRLSLEIRPLDELGEDSNLFLILFQEIGKPFSPEEIIKPDSAQNGEDTNIKLLEAELRSTKEHLQTTIEELETSNEELKSSNEELLSMNEELQSSNEELQTSKEELQSINEELETVNTELRNKIEELDTANNDLQNFFQSTNIATIFLDRTLHIKKFTPAVSEVFNLLETDLGRPVTDIMPRLKGVDIRASVKECLEKLNVIEREVRLMGDDDEYYIMRITPYRTIDNVIDGVVVTFVNISEMRQSRLKTEQRERQQAAIAELGLFAVQNPDLRAIFDKACALGKKILKTDFIKVLRLQPDGKEFQLISGIGWQDELVGEGLVSAELDSQAGYTLHINAPVIVKNLNKEIRFQGPPLLTDHEVISGISVVIYKGREPFGVLGTHTTEKREFTQDEVNFLQSFANILAAAVQHSENLQDLRDSEERLALALGAAHMGTWEWWFDTDRAILSKNFGKLLGLREGESIKTGEEFFERVHPEDLPQMKQRVEEAVKQGKDYYIEFRIIRDDDKTQRWLIGQGKVIYSETGEPLKMVGVNYDITERKLIEEKLHKADRQKNDFLAILGHELRNPLSPLSNTLEILKDSESDEDFNKLRQVMERQVDHMKRLVDDLLDISRISHGKIKLQPEPLELKKLIDDLAGDFEKLVREKNLRLEVSLPEEEIWVSGDAVRLTQAIGNLIANALKFSRSGGSIDIQLTADNQNAYIAVEDDGVGMSKEVLELVFEPFVQEDKTLDSTHGGLGLGLPLVKGLIELHDGKITAESEGKNKGSRFVVQLQRIDSPKKSPDRKTKKSLDADDRSRKILVVEDHQDSAETLKFYLEANNHQVEIAPDAKTAIKKAKKQVPEVIICDIGLPGKMSGYDVITELKKDKKFESTYCIALSGYGQAGDKERSKSVGFKKHLVKPVNFDELTELLRQINS